MRRALHIALIAALVPMLLLPLPARAVDAADHLDKAAACRRRAKPTCALQWAERAQAALTDADSPLIRREAALVRAESLALLDRPDEAAKAFEALLALQPDWRPPSDADPRVLSAVDAARRAGLSTRLPDHLDPGLPPQLPPPDPLTLLPEPALYSPDRLVNLDPDAHRNPRWRLSIGAGVALITKPVNRRYDVGPTIALEISRDLKRSFALWLQVSLTLLSYDSRVVAEPGEGRGLTAVSAVIGAQTAIRIAGNWYFVAALGIGGGAFGTRSIGQAAGLSAQGSVGIRWQLDKHLALRLDALPQGILRTDGSTGLAGHVGIVARGEIRF
ncbi:MAG: hypothetical protein R3F39_04715 [Myxococcota bacterium]